MSLLAISGLSVVLVNRKLVFNSLHAGYFSCFLLSSADFVSK